MSSVPGTERGGSFLFGNADSDICCGLCVLGLGFVLAPHGHLQAWAFVLQGIHRQRTALSVEVEFESVM